MVIPLLMLLAAQPRVDVGVVFAKVSSVELKMDVYRPAATSAGLKAAVVVIHGGAWSSGTKAEMAPLSKFIASKGMVAAAVAYRLAPEFTWPAQLDDVQTAVRYLRVNAAKYGIDPNRIGAAGASAGGQLALLLGMRDTRNKKNAPYQGVSSRVSAVLDLFGPTDLSKFPKDFDLLYPVLFAKARKDAGTAVRDASPLHFVDKRSAPVFIYQGLKDKLVDPSQSRALEARYRALGRPVEAVYLPGIAHEFKQSDPRCVDAIEKGVAFLGKWLKVTPATSFMRRPGPSDRASTSFADLAFGRA